MTVQNISEDLSVPADKKSLTLRQIFPYSGLETASFNRG